MLRGTSLFVAAIAIVAPAQAGDNAPRLLGGHAKAPKIYPISESHYIKQFAGPTIAPCAPCFGYYRTQWRSWAEACNEPQPIDLGPPQYAPPPGTVIPEPDKTGTPPAVPKIEPGSKDPEKKDPPKVDPPKKDPPKVESDKKEPPKIELPKVEPDKKDPPKKEKTSLVLPATEQTPMPAGRFEIAIPTLPQALPTLTKPAESVIPIVPVPAPAPIPTVIVPITVKS